VALVWRYGPGGKQSARVGVDLRSRVWVVTGE
jgi:hypothetical protein